MISINNLQKKFGEKLAVNIDHYEINQGDMLGLVGNNGAGKTTLFRLMLDLLKADNLHFIVTGRDLKDAAVARAVDLSAEKYCSVALMLEKAVNITHSYEVVAA